MNNDFKGSVDFFNMCMSVYIRLREFHFNTHIQAEHNLTNDAMPEIMEYADAVMENQMGISDSRPGMDILTFTPCKESTITSTLQYLAKEISTYRDKLDEISQVGIINALDDFAQVVNKWIYLSRNK